MPKKCNFINCGKINKYIFLIFLEALLFLASLFVESQTKFYKIDNLYIIIDRITKSFGSLLSFILLIIYNKKNERKINTNNQLLIKKRNKNKIGWKKKILWILLVSIIYFISIIPYYIIWLNRKNNISSLVFYFIFLTFFSNLLLKNKLYMHHYICIIISAILDILIRVIFGESIIEHITEEYFFYLLKISYILFVSLELVLYKYYMFIKYIKSYEILFF